MTETTQRDQHDDDQGDADGRWGRTGEVIRFPKHTGAVWPLPGDEEDQDPTIPNHPDGQTGDPGEDRETGAGDREELDDDSREDREAGALVLRPDGGMVPVGTPGTLEDTDDGEGEDSRPVVLVDPDPRTLGGTKLPWELEESRKPIIPDWLTDRRTRVSAFKWAAKKARYVTGFHAARVPVYAGRLLARSPRGAFRVSRDWFNWVRDAESRPLVTGAIQANDPEMHMKLTEKSVGRQRVRGTLSVLVAITGTIAFGTAVVVLPLPGLLLIAAVLIGLLGKAGTNDDKPVLSRATTALKIPELTSSQLITALGSLGLARLNAALKPGGQGVGFPDEIARHGEGYRAVIDLPYGVTAAHVIERKEELASGLRRTRGMVWPEGDSSVHEGRLIVWVGDEDFAKAKQPAWPLTKAGEFDIFADIPFGTDQRGQTVAFCLMYTSMLLGAIPRMGKTFAVRLLLLAAALDPTVILYVYDLKGLGDLKALEKVSHRYGCGPADDATVDLVMDGLRELSKEVDRRAEAMRRLPADVLPENQLTSAAAKNLKLKLQPIVCGIDECHGLFTSKHATEAEALCQKILKLGPAMGIMLLLATQRPDKESIPTSLSALVGVRCAMRVKGHQENDMILGTSAHQNGLKATAFTRNDKGIGILDGHADEHQVVRTYKVEAAEAEAITDRALAARQAAGTLTGHATGDTPTTGPAFSLLADLASIWPAGEDKVWSTRLCELLTGLRPDHYRGLDQHGLAGQLKPYGIETDQVWYKPAGAKGANRRGVHRTDLDKARRALNREQAAGPDGAAD
ncbi:FtsK/SpoIIIE domain-containing protein [Microlunatus speluncae]|uniref:FtsK/SpoIIIE domain-containing protein n=1 Tax=Microlunatus speluncae TaxID=2594267 RepID=UPI001266887B|nr:FtsK/SpoIIIE domain-containing protein [Microlunatus speluncae]